MTIRIASNTLSLNAQRRLANNTSLLSAAYEKISSGQRINRASDDAAGLAIASALQTNVRIYSQGIRNLSDGISALSIADGGLQALTDICLRQLELAEQAANGTYTLAQRAAMNTEANALVDEFNRIVSGVAFNGRKLLAPGQPGGGDLRIQAGVGVEGSLTAGTAVELSRSVGDGTLGEAITINTPSSPAGVEAYDFNGDGKLDLAATGWAGGMWIYNGNGDGTFKAPQALGALAKSFVIQDFNNDGRADIAEADANEYRVFLGQGGGVFSAAITGAAPNNNCYGVAAGDVNGDGLLDLAYTNYGASSASVLLGRGDGRFQAGVTLQTGLHPGEINMSDLDSDGNLDLISTDFAGLSISVLRGNGDGTFAARRSYAVGKMIANAEIGDLNGDGILDIAAADFIGSAAVILMGRGDGTFNPMQVHAAGTNIDAVELVDLNGDGCLDIATADRGGNSSSILIGRGDGTFQAARSYAMGDGDWYLTSGDFNGDGAVDIATSSLNAAKLVVRFGKAHQVTSAPKLNMCTREGALAAMSTIEDTLERIGRQRAAIGAAQNRFGAALNNLGSARENFSAAASRITDADIAQESAALVRLRILQEAGAAVLGQANTQPALALSLLTA